MARPFPPGAGGWWPVLVLVLVLALVLVLVLMLVLVLALVLMLVPHPKVDAGESNICEGRGVGVGGS